MEKDEKAMFDFLTEPENYEKAKRLKQHLDKVNQNLVKEFWTEVFNRVSPVIGRGVFNSYLHPNCSDIRVFKSEWKRGAEFEPLSFSYWSLGDGAYFGLLYNSKARKFNFAETLVMRDALLARYPQGTTDNDDGQWVIWKRNGLDLRFNNEDTLGQILPARREQAVEAIANEFIEFIKTCYEVVDDFVQKH